jgi:uncharacterized protein (DUF2236 family)
VLLLRAAVPDLRERLGAALFLRVAGPEGPQRRERIHGRPGPRWFPSGSPIQRVHGDASMFVGGMRALMLQSLHPAAMTAVAEHSGFRGDMWGRLARTSTFLATTTFGTAEDAQAAVDAVRRIHDGISGSLSDGGRYAASDPHLLTWVHVAEVDSFLLAHQTYGVRPLDRAGRDAYVAQTAEVAERLGVIEPPRTESALRDTLARYRPELRGTDHARDAIGYLVWHPELPLAARPGYLVLAAAATGLLPPWARRELGLPDFAPAAERTMVRALGRCATGAIRWAMAPPPAPVAAPAGSG